MVTSSRTDCILLLLITLFVPGEALLVEGYYYLRTFVIGFLGEHQISLLRVFPAERRTSCKYLNAGGQRTPVVTLHVRFLTSMDSKDKHVEIFISEDVHQRHLLPPEWRSTSVVWFFQELVCNSTETRVPETLMVHLIISI